MLSHIVWSTNIDPSGYSSCARSYIKSLYQNERCDVSVIINNVARNINLEGIDKDDLLFFSSISTSKISSSDILVQHCVPDRMLFGPGRKILYTVTEMPCPERWVRICNNCDIIMTASSFCKEMMIKSGIKEDIIEVVPHCHDPLVWNKNVIPLNISNLKNYNFLFMGDFTPRKNGDMVLKSFLKTFHGRQDVSMTFKVYFNSFSLSDQTKLINKFRNIAKSVESDESKWPPIYFYGEPIIESLIPRFMASFDCLVSPHRGEGWGLALSQMMALGKTVISTGYSGNLEFMDQYNSYLIDICGFEYVSEDMIKINPNFSGFEWPIIKENSICEALFDVEGDRVSSKKMGERAAVDISSKFSYEKISNRIIDIVEKIKA